MVLLQLRIPLITWFVVNDTADINNFRLIFLDTSRVSREEVCLPSFDVVNCLLKQLVICFGEDTTESAKVMVSFPAFGGDLPSIALIVIHSLERHVLWSSVSRNCLHLFLRCLFVVLAISSFICCRAGEVGSLDLRSSRAVILSNISAGNGSVLIRCRPEGICRDAAFRMMVHKIFSPFWQFVGSRLLLSLSSISLRYQSQFAFFKLKLVRWGMGLIVRSICKQMRFGRWSEPMSSSASWQK